MNEITPETCGYADGHRCTCRMRPATHIEPAEWEQDAWCLTHPDVAQIRAEVEHNKDALFVRAERAERARDEAERAATEAERDAGVMLARAETAEANLAASMEAHAVTAGEVARLREGIEALMESWYHDPALSSPRRYISDLRALLGRGQ